MRSNTELWLTVLSFCSTFLVCKILCEKQQNTSSLSILLILFSSGLQQSGRNPSQKALDKYWTTKTSKLRRWSEQTDWLVVMQASLLITTTTQRVMFNVYWCYNKPYQIVFPPQRSPIKGLGTGQWTHLVIFKDQYPHLVYPNIYA